MGGFLVRILRAGECQHHLQVASLGYVFSVGEPYLREITSREFYRPYFDLHSGFFSLTPAYVFQSCPIRQPFAQLGLAEPRALNPKTGERPVFVFQSRLALRRQQQSTVHYPGYEDCGEVSVHVPFLEAVNRLITERNSLE